MKKAIQLTIVSLLVITANTYAQPDTFEEIASYLNTSQKAMEKCKRSFGDFDQAVRIRDLSSLSWRLKQLKADTKNLNSVIYAMERLDGDVWYLTKVKAFTKTFYDIVYLRMDEIVKGMEELGKTEYLNNKYAVAKTDLELVIKEVKWAEKLLLAKMVFAPNAESFCISSLKVAKYATTSSLGTINLGPIEGEENRFKVSYLPEGALEGYLYVDTAGQNVVRFIMNRNESKKRAYDSFNNLIYSVLACEHEEFDITDKVIPVDEVDSQISNYPVFKARPKDKSILYSIEVSMQDAIVDGIRTWEVYVEYEHTAKK